MRRIDGKYEVIKPLGEGFGGFVFLVHSQGKKTALKQLRMRQDHDCFSPEEILDSFKKEFTTLKNLNHPHILQILDFGFDRGENFYYFTTEYIEGQNIFDATRGLSPEVIEELFVQILRALSYLHSRNVFHFDIKPDNILVEKNEEGRLHAKLIDFGLSAFQKEGVLAGSPAYLAPESLLERPKDGRADLYSLGVTWYKCLAGTNPFEKDDLKKMVALHRIWMPPPISNQSSQIPPYLDPILEKLLKKNPTERYHRADQVIRDLNWSAAQHYPLETEATALAYLPGEGQLVGRGDSWGQLISFFNRIFLSRSQTKGCVMILGDAGTGKSRLLKELKYFSQLQGITTLDLREISMAEIKSDSVILADNADSEILDKARFCMTQFIPHSIFVAIAGRELQDPLPMSVSISLKNFDRIQVAQYVSSILGITSPPEFLVEEIYSRTEGNPLFLTDLLQSLIQSHQIFDEQGKWSLSLLEEVGLDFNKYQVPKTLTEYCERRFHRLTRPSQRILSLVALSKIPLSMTHLSKLEEGMGKEAIEILEKESLVRVQPQDSVLKLLNPNFSDWVQKIRPSSELAAYHQALGRLFQAEKESEEAAWYHLGLGQGAPEERFSHLIRYGEAMLGPCRWMEAADAFRVASDLPISLEKKMEAQLKVVSALFRAGQPAGAFQILEEIQNILKKERENPDQWRWIQKTFREMGNTALKAGRLDLARESLKVSRVLLETHEENPVELMLLDNFQASLLMREGKLVEAEALSEKTHKLWEKMPIEDKKKVLNNELPLICLALGKILEAKILLKSQAAFFEEIGHLAKQAHSLYGWAAACYKMKELDEAVTIYNSCIDLSRKIKSEELLFHAFNGLGNIAFSRHEWDSAAGHYQKALELAQHSADRDSSVGITINLAHVLRLQRDRAGAMPYLRHVIDTLESQLNLSLHQLNFLAEAYLELGKLQLENQNWEEARDAFRDAVKMVRHHPALEAFRFSALVGLIEADLHLRKEGEAKTLFMELDRSPLSPSEKMELDELRNGPQGI